MPQPDRPDGCADALTFPEFENEPFQYSLDLQDPIAEENRFDGLVVGDLLESERREVVRLALEVLAHEHQPGEILTTPPRTKEYLRLLLAERRNEVFGVLFLDNRHRVLAFEELFYGTVDGASVHPRVVVQRALLRNAAACILCHNHPSGIAEPSRADMTITDRLKKSLELVDVRVLDHMVVGAEEVVSFAERGLL